MPTYNVSNTSELSSAITSASDGDTIICADGNYTNITITKTFTDYVTIVAANLHQAVFAEVVFTSGAAYIVFDGMRVKGAGGQHCIDFPGGSNCSYITIQNCDIGADSGYGIVYGISCNDCSHISYLYNHLHNVNNGTTSFQTDYPTLIGNTADWVSADSYKFSGPSTGGWIENNFAARNIYYIEGAHNDFVQGQGDNCTNYTFKGNVMMMDAGADTTVQGIFGPFTNTLIEQNIILSAQQNGINPSTGCTVRYNYVINVPLFNPGESDVCIISPGAGSTVEYNVWSVDVGSQGWDGTNLKIQTISSGASYYVGDQFTNFVGAGTTYAGLVPKEGSDIGTTIGAYTRLMELLGAEPPVTTPNKAAVSNGLLLLAGGLPLLGA